MKSHHRLPVLVEKFASESEFIEFWAEQYDDPRDHLYSENIGKNLTPVRLRDLFEWKNGGPIAKRKMDSIERNYINTKPIAPRAGNRDEQIAFITQPGGAIWRIFWLHCHSPASYPIFDQHVYRAMKYIQLDQVLEIPNLNRLKVISYIDEYLPFHASFNCENKKRLDEALWSFGKYIKVKTRTRPSASRSPRK
jgi:hypothetical protein